MTESGKTHFRFCCREHYVSVRELPTVTEPPAQQIDFPRSGKPRTSTKRRIIPGAVIITASSLQPECLPVSPLSVSARVLSHRFSLGSWAHLIDLSFSSFSLTKTLTMFRPIVPRLAGRTISKPLPQTTFQHSFPVSSIYVFGRSRRGYATESGRPAQFPRAQSPLVATIANLNAEEHDLVIIGGGVAGYVAAIKAGQEGLKVFVFLLYYLKTMSMHVHLTACYETIDRLYRKERRLGRYMSQCRMYPIKITSKQFPPLPPSSPRYQKARHRSRGCET